ncbi:putative UPF0662 protein C30C2.08 [Glarea lozoyensis 74030]|uniref:Putative UPF0662 protein C30C2.08 n=1 Tax=Glarea lozoyensis (strain ATCC 74030 / MF5533) TaxID=1104152 RepID=H0EQP9_GLAL7|nr:putative UPF0662 protein C30C2.08 [Glarea lozoyensis 74030]
MVKAASSSHSENFITLLSNRIEVCQRSLVTLNTRLARLSDEIMPTYEKLISILRSLSLANTKSKFSATEVQKLQAQLKEIDAQRKEGKFVTVNGEVLAGDHEVSELLTKGIYWANMVLERKGVCPEPFREKYQTLVEIRNKLEKLSLTQAWSLRETDLYDYQRQLDRIDESRIDGNFVDSEGNFAELYVQRLNSLDNMRVDGKFMVGKEIPEGQGSVIELLSECFELNYELRVAAEQETDD